MSIPSPQPCSDPLVSLFSESLGSLTATKAPPSLDAQEWAPLVLRCAEEHRPPSTLLLFKSMGLNLGSFFTYRSSLRTTLLHELIAIDAHWALFYVQLLQEQGDLSVLNACNSEGRTPLHCAVACRETELVQCLLKAGASVNAQNRHGRTPLAEVLFLFRDHSLLTPLLYCLLEHGADPDIVDQQGCTAIHYAAAGHPGEGSDVRFFQALMDKTSSLNAFNAEGYTPLMVMARENVFQVSECYLRALLSRADLNILDHTPSPRHLNAAHWALHSLNFQVFQVLIPLTDWTHYFAGMGIHDSSELLRPFFQDSSFSYSFYKDLIDSSLSLKRLNTVLQSPSVDSSRSVLPRL